MNGLILLIIIVLITIISFLWKRTVVLRKKIDSWRNIAIEQRKLVNDLNKRS